MPADQSDKPSECPKCPNCGFLIVGPLAFEDATTLREFQEAEEKPYWDAKVAELERENTLLWEMLHVSIPVERLSDPKWKNRYQKWTNSDIAARLRIEETKGGVMKAKDQFSLKHRRAAKSLHEEYSTRPWFQAVGLGEKDGKPALYLYLLRNSKEAKEITEYSGFPVIAEKIGPIMPLGSY